MQDMTAYGPIIVDPPSGQSDGCPVEYDDDLVMMTSDYYHVSRPALQAFIMPLAERSSTDTDRQRRSS